MMTNPSQALTASDLRGWLPPELELLICKELPASLIACDELWHVFLPRLEKEYGEEVLALFFKTELRLTMLNHQWQSTVNLKKNQDKLLSLNESRLLYLKSRELLNQAVLPWKESPLEIYKWFVFCTTFSKTPEGIPPSLECLEYCITFNNIALYRRVLSQFPFLEQERLRETLLPKLIQASRKSSVWMKYAINDIYELKEKDSLQQQETYLRVSLTSTDLQMSLSPLDTALILKADDVIERLISKHSPIPSIIGLWILSHNEQNPHKRVKFKALFNKLFNTLSQEEHQLLLQFRKTMRPQDKYLLYELASYIKESATPNRFMNLFIFGVSEWNCFLDYFFEALERKINPHKKIVMQETLSLEATSGQLVIASLQGDIERLHWIIENSEKTLSLNRIINLAEQCLLFTLDAVEKSHLDTSLCYLFGRVSNLPAAFKDCVLEDIFSFLMLELPDTFKVISALYQTETLWPFLFKSQQTIKFYTERAMRFSSFLSVSSLYACGDERVKTEIKELLIARLNRNNDPLLLVRFILDQQLASPARMFSVALKAHNFDDFWKSLMEILKWFVKENRPFNEDAKITYEKFFDELIAKIVAVVMTPQECAKLLAATPEEHGTLLDTILEKDDTLFQRIPESHDALQSCLDIKKVQLEKIWRYIFELFCLKLYPDVIASMTKEKLHQVIKRLFCAIVKIVRWMSVLDNAYWRKLTDQMQGMQGIPVNLKEHLNHYLDTLEAFNESRHNITLNIAEYLVSCSVGVGLGLAKLCQDPLMYQHIFEQILLLGKETYLYILLVALYNATCLFSEEEINELEQEISETISSMKLAFEAVEQKEMQLSFSLSL